MVKASPARLARGFPINPDVSLWLIMGTLPANTDKFGAGLAISNLVSDTEAKNCQMTLVTCELVRHPRIFRSPEC